MDPLEAFTARLYADIRGQPIRLPVEAQAAVDGMLGEERLGSYRSLDGIERALGRVSLRLSARLGRELRLEGAVAELVAHFEGLGSDFAEFFPLLRAHVERRRLK
jgi:acyl carrier protein phosphodiesterase